MKYFVPVIFKGWFIASSLFTVLLFPSLVLANGPDLSVSKSCVIASPQTIKCDVVVTNIGTVPTLPQFTITDTVTATPVVNYLSVGGSLATSCSPGPQQINNVSIVCNVTGSLAVGASGTAIFDFSMPTGGEFQNCASTTLPVNPMAPPDSNSLNNTDICTTLTVDPPTPSPAAQDLSTDKVCAVNGVQSILCTITITNVGGTASSNPFTLSDVVTANNTVNLTGAGGTLNPSCSPGAQVINNVPINCTINSSLAPNASGTVLLSFTMPQGGQFENCATVATSQNAAQAPDSNAANNKDCATLTVEGPPPPPAQDLSTDKVCAVNGVQSILCTITITNVGGTASSNPFTLSDVVTANNTVNLTGAGGTLNPSCSPGAQVINNVPINCTINSSLAPNASGTVLLSFTMPQGGQFENCATVATSQNAAQAPDSNAANNQDCATLTVDGPPPPPAQDLSTDKVCAVNGAQSILCTITITNVGGTASSNPFTLSDVVTANNTVNLTGAGGTLNPSCSPGAQVINNVPINCTINSSLAPNASGTVLLSFAMPQGGQFENCATVATSQNAAQAPDSNSSNNSDCATLTVDGPPPPPAQDLSTDKVCAVNGAQSILCTITITNVGGTASSNPFTLSDVVTSNNTVNLTGAGGTLNPSCSPGAQMINNVPINCTINSSLAPNASGTVLLSFTMPQGGEFENCATVATSQNAAQAPDSNAANNKDCATLTVDGPPPPPAQDLSTDKVCAVNGAQSILCTITITNVGGTASSNPFTLSDVVTSNNTVNLTGAGGTLNPSCSPGAQVINNVPINCTINSSLAPNASGTVLLSFTMPQGGQFENCATVATSQNAAQAPDSNSSNNSDCATLTVDGPPPPPAQDLSADKVCAVNGVQSILCTITITNVGGTASSNPFTLSDVVTANNTVNLTGAGGTLNPSCSPGAQVINNVPINCTINSSLAPNASGTVLLSFTMPQGGQFENCATVATSQNAAQAPDSNAANNQDCATLTVNGPPPPPPQDLSADKVCAVNGAQSILCTITITNVGGTASSNPFTLSDVVTANNTVNLTGAGGTLNPSCSPGAQVINNVPINCTINSSLAPNASGTVLLSFTMPQGGQFENCATVATSQNAAQAPDSNSSNNSDCATLTVDGPPPPPAQDLSANKVCEVNGAQSILCTITITNVGGTASSNPFTLSDVVTANNTVNLTGAGGTLNPSCSPGAQVINNVPINCTINSSLAPNASGTVLLSFTMPQGGQFENCATVATSQNAAQAPDSNAANNKDCATLIVTPPNPVTGPDLSLNKSCVLNGDQGIRCTVTMANLGGAPTVAPITLSDVITASSTVNYIGNGGTIPISCTPGPQIINGVPISCTANISLAANASESVFFDFTMPAGGSFSNCISGASAQNVASLPDTNASNNTNICSAINVTGSDNPKGPDLSATKICSATGAAIDCTVTVTNIGDVAINTAINLTDLVTGSTAVNLLSASGSLPIGCTPGAQQINGVPINCTGVVQLQPGAQGNAFFSFMMPAGGEFQNCASVAYNANSAMQPDINPANNTNICTTLTVTSTMPDLELKKVCELQDGQGVMCKITYTNVGNATFVGSLSISDQATSSSPLQFIGSDSICATTAPQNNNIVSNCSNWLTVPPNGTGVVNFSYVMPQGGSFDNCVSGTFNNQYAQTPSDPNAANNTNICISTLVVPDPKPKVPDLSVGKTCSMLGGFVQCVVTYTNEGDVALAGPVTFSDVVSGSSTINYIGVSFTTPMACTPTPVSQQINGQPLSCTLNAGMNPGEVQSFDMLFSMPAGGRFSNCVSATSGQNASTQPDNQSANNTDICTTLVVPGTELPKGPDLSVAKSCQEKEGQLIHCTISVTNVGDANSVAPLTLADLATGTSQVDLINISSSHPLSCTPTPPLLINNVPLNCSSTVALAPSQVFTADFVYSMPTGGRFYNCVSADSGKNAANPGDTNTVNNTNICTTVAVTSSKADTGTITIIKDARPNHAQDFNFTSSSAAIKPFTLDDDSDPALPNQTTFSNVAPGLYSFTEATVSGWSLAGIECSSGVEYKTDQATGTVSLVLSANSNVSCTFFNEQRLNDTSQICGIKFNDLNGNGKQEAGELGLPGWQITAVSVKPILIESTTTNIKGEYCFTNLPVGNYQLVESPQAPWQQTFPANGNPHLVTLAAGQKVTGINFGNTIPGGSCSPAMQGIGPGTLANGNFEAEQFTLNTPFSFENESLVTGWETTQADGLIEFWSSGYQNVPAYNGNQFIEVNAHTGATIMQNFTATPGSTVTISFAHRGRRGFPNQMQVAIGPMGGLPVTLGTYTGALSNWTVHTVSYTFPNNGLTSYVIGFTAMDTTAGGNFLDAISMIDIACETLGPPTDVPPIDRVVLDFLEDRYPDFFRGKYTLGSLDGYNYRFYEETNTYMAIDGGDRIFMLGSFTDDMVIFLGTKNDLAQAISNWERGPVSDAKLFSFAEATYPEIFPGEYVSGRLNQFDYRFYPQSGNYLAVDNAGMIYVLGPYTNNVILNVGPVEAFRSAILGQ